MKEKIINYIKLHLCILLYTFSTVMSKVTAQYDFLSIQFILCFGCIFLILGVYAIFWQQVIKNFNASVAYSNKSVTTIWTLLFANLFFHEGITIHNVIGALIIVCGVILVAQRDE